MRIDSPIRWLLLVTVMLAFSAKSFAQIGISITIGPPALPVYVQPPCPAGGYIWTPGYWAYDYDEGDYYWVPGTWVLAPVGLLWTPGYWAWGNGVFVWNEGYWGPHVGFYGGIVYGFGYFGEGYEGGRWDNGQFYYNRSVNNVNVTNIHNVYNTTVINNNTTTVNRVSYNGGNGGTDARPTPQDEAAARERHVSPVAAQTQHVQAARANPQLRASTNHGKPPIAATPKPGAFNDHGVVKANAAGAPYHAPANRAATQPEANASAGHPENTVPRPPTAVHPSDLQPHQRPAPPNTGNPKLEQEIPGAAGKALCQAGAGTSETAAEAGPGAPTSGQATGGRSQKAADGATAPATNAANGAKTRTTTAAATGKTAAASAGQASTGEALIA